MNESQQAGIVIFAVLGLIAFIIILIISAIRSANIASKQHKQKMNDMKAKEFGTFKHIVGLPIPENVMCQVYYCEDKLSIVGGGSTFNLSLDKIRDMTTATDIEIQKAYVSSVGGAVAGGLLFGPLGAIVGGRAKKKETKQVTVYFVITYDKDGKPEYISFDTAGSFKANKFISLFKQRPQVTRAAVEL